MKPSRLILPILFCACSVANAQNSKLCSDLEANIDRALKEIAYNSMLAFGDNSAPRVSMLNATATNYWLEVRSSLDQMRDQKCAPLPYAASSSRYATSATRCIISNMNPNATERARLCARASWSVGPDNGNAPAN